MMYCLWMTTDILWVGIQATQPVRDGVSEGIRPAPGLPLLYAAAAHSLQPLGHARTHIPQQR